jgi:hypothetical protein
MIGKSTIVVEDKLKEVFNYLPAITGSDSNNYVPIFKVGDEKELLAFFAQSQGNTKYPLIWLVMPYLEEHINRNRVIIKNLSLILAVETSSELLNSERLDLTFKPILYKLLDNVLDVFTVSNTIYHDNTYNITKYSNYEHDEDGSGEFGGFVDIWDAIKLTIDVSINSNCLREIKI